MSLGTAIITIRKARKMGQSDLPEVITQSALSQIENGKKSPSPATIEKLCKALDIPIYALYIIATKLEDVPAPFQDDFLRSRYAILEQLNLNT